MPVHTDFVKNNEQYAATFGEKGALPLAPGKKLAIGEQDTGISILFEFNFILLVTCMDARIK
jgi:hypothetical protein